MADRFDVDWLSADDRDADAYLAGVRVGGRSVSGGAAPSPVIEYWFTGPTPEHLDALTRELASLEMVAETDPWCPFPPERRPQRPWSLVLCGPSSLDPTRVAATADEYGCAWHPLGGGERWLSPISPAPTRLSLRTVWQRATSVFRRR